MPLSWEQSSICRPVRRCISLRSIRNTPSITSLTTPAGAGARRWVAGRRDKPESILFVFDAPVDIAQCAFEAEEREVARTQVVCAEYLAENAGTYRPCFIQEFNFSPGGATYQRESIAVNLHAVSRFRLTVKADKGGQGTPSLTTLRLYG